MLPSPAVFLELTTFLTRTTSLTLNLCGKSEVTVTGPLTLEIPVIIFGLRFVIAFELLRTLSSLTVLDSCRV